eukprot:6210245-Pleurochrysis_carterae.AAC.2
MRGEYAARHREPEHRMSKLYTPMDVNGVRVRMLRLRPPFDVAECRAHKTLRGCLLACVLLTSSRYFRLRALVSSVHI